MPFLIIFSQDVRDLDRCMNEGSSLDLTRKKQMHGQFLYPKVLSITHAQDLKILDGCLNGGIVIGSFECMINNKAIK